MGATSKIEWTDATWEPITGCTLVSEGCRNCYAAALAAGRMQHHPSMAGLAKRNAMGVAQFTGEVRFNREWLKQPLRWRKPMTIFVCSRGDLFHPDVPDEWIGRVFAVMALAPHHFFRVLTKRPERMRDYMSDPRRSHKLARAVIDEFLCGTVPKGWLSNETWSAHWPIDVEGDPEDPSDVFLRHWPLPNVGLGVSVEDQATADERIPHLLATPAVMRFVSAEPLLGPVDLTHVTHRDRKQFSWLAYDPTLNALTGCYPLLDGGPRGPHPRRLHEVIVGGESGKHARPMHPEWARSLRGQCAEAGVSFFFKQWGEWLPGERNRGQFDPKPMHGYRRCDNHTYEWPPHRAVLNFGTHPDRFSGDLTARRVGKKAAGAMLDGRDHLDVAPQITAHFAKPGAK